MGLLHDAGSNSTADNCLHTTQISEKFLAMGTIGVISNYFEVKRVSVKKKKDFCGAKGLITFNFSGRALRGVWSLLCEGLFRLDLPGTSIFQVEH